MSMFNKQGKEFTNLATVQRDPNTEPTFKYKFPTLVGAKVVERWAKKVRPIKDLTHLLRGCQLKRNQDYMVDYNDATGLYEYWFENAGHCLMFQIASSSVLQAHRTGSGHRFDIECPHCQKAFPTTQITWV